MVLYLFIVLYSKSHLCDSSEKNLVTTLKTKQKEHNTKKTTNNLPPPLLPLQKNKQRPKSTKPKQLEISWWKKLTVMTKSI